MAERSRLEGLHPIIDRLIEDYRSARAPQALLLSGAKGIGKQELAGFLASILLCLSGDKPCGECTACQRASRGAHANLLQVRLAPRERSIKIEALRDLLEILSLHPQEPGHRVILIDEIDTLTVQAQNALLKSLEEPIPGDYFLLTTKNEAAVLPTILSRCRLIRLLPWPTDKVRDFLLSEGLTAQRAAELAPISGGLPGLALQLNEDKDYWAARELVATHVLPTKHFHMIPDAAQALKDSKDNGELILDLVEQAAQDALHARVGSVDSANPWQDASPAALKSVMQAVFEARRYRNSNVSWQSVMDRLLFTIAKEIYSCQWS